jgi:hypothetical protein
MIYDFHLLCLLYEGHDVQRPFRSRSDERCFSPLGLYPNISASIVKHLGFSWMSVLLVMSNLLYYHVVLLGR